MYWCWRVPPVLSWCVRNKAMKYLSIFALLWPLSVWACDPAEFNVQAFLQANDHNRDGALQRSELVDAGAVGHLNPASGFGPWPQAEALLGRLDAR